jgi:hypothetical protein
MTPIWFGSPSTFGVKELMDGIGEYGPEPQPQKAAERADRPRRTPVTGFVFKVQANMDPKHRDRVAFVRLASGHFERGMKLLHVRSKKPMAVSNPVLFLAADRELAEEAWAGDIIGIPNHGQLRIGDALTEGEALRFHRHPVLRAGTAAIRARTDPMKAKHLEKALMQFAEEGAAKVFKPMIGSGFIVGVVGALQFEVLASRIEQEYGLPVRFEGSQFTSARWMSGPKDKVEALATPTSSTWPRPRRRRSGGYLTRLQWDIDRVPPSATIPPTPPLKLTATKEMMVAGFSELAALNALLIAHLRKKRFPRHAPRLFRRLWQEEAEALLAELPARWLISSVITFGDHGWNEGQRRVGLAMNVLFSLMKLYEFERLYSGLPPDRAHPLRRSPGIALPLDMPSFSLLSGGLDINLLAQIWDMSRDEPVAGRIACHLLQALNDDPRSLFRRIGLMRGLRNGPTPIQAGAIPPALEGRDVLGIAQTGTGKTASFTLPMITLLGRGRARARMPRSLVLCPTRELAAQVAENFDTYAKHTRLTKALLIGGVSFGEQDKLIDRGVDVLIATPGRLLDHFERGKLLLTGVQIMVVDEADRMLDMGFIPDIERIFQLTPFTRQTLFFSATMAPEIERITDTFLHTPERIEVARQATTSETITQKLVEITPTRRDQSAKQKRELLRALIRAEGEG